MGKSLTYAVASLLFAINAAPAFAQAEFSKDNLTRLIRKVGIHGTVGVRKPTDADVTKGMTKGVSVGLAPGRTSGWKFPAGISWYSEELNGPAGDQFANLKMTPIFAGIGYGWHFGKLSTSVAMQAGYSINKISRAGTPGLAFASGEPTSISVSNSFILRPRWHTEYFLTEKFTLRTTLNYIMTDPKIVVTTPAGSQPGSWKGNAINAAVGIGYYPFRR